MSRLDYPSPKDPSKGSRGFPRVQLDLQICKPFEVRIGICNGNRDSTWQPRCGARQVRCHVAMA
jgi:hypothetical protein